MHYVKKSDLKLTGLACPKRKGASTDFCRLEAEKYPESADCHRPGLSFRRMSLNNSVVSGILEPAAPEEAQIRLHRR